MAKTNGRAKKFSDWDEKPVKDYDPEAEIPIDDEDDSAGASDDSENENAATEHYISVGKSTLRRKEAPSLGPNYRGTRISRDALDQSTSGNSSDEFEDAREDFDDPDQADLERDLREHEDEDAEIDSDDAFAESDDDKFEGFTFRGSSQPLPVRGKRVDRATAADYLDDEAEESEDHADSSIGSDEDEEEGSGDDDGSDLDGFIDDGDDSDLANDDALSVDEDGTKDNEVNSDPSSEDEADDIESSKPTRKTGRADIKAVMGIGKKTERTNVQTLMGTETVSEAGAKSTSVPTDVAKGTAVRQQRKAFDAALNIRIRLQKALVAVNSLSTIDDVDSQSAPYEAAEAAAIKLLNTLQGFRVDMQPKAGKKRKRTFEVSTSSQDIWNRMQKSVERPAIIRRKAVLDNWAKKAKATQAINPAVEGGNKFMRVNEPLTMILENQMQDSERLIKRTRTPRSCAPIQVAQKMNEADIYDDADFYQLLLKELVDQRTADTSSTGGQAATVRYAAVKEAKNKKHVETKASKGRKMRFNVHEKLQNFMAPEDRRGWEQHAIDRFFGTLFGQKLVLNEDEVSDQDMDGAEAEGLRLFRN